MARVGAVLAALLAGTGCSVFGGGGPTAQDGADALATALTSGKLTGLSFQGGTAQQAQGLWTRAVDGLGDSTHTVRVGTVTEGKDGRPTTATLTYRWKLAGTGTPWTYRTTAQLREDPAGDGWQVRLAPTLVHPDLRAGQRLAMSTSLAGRAGILGAGGKPIVEDRPVVRLGIDKTKVPAARQAGAARTLARRLELSPAPFLARVRAAGPKAFVEAVVLRRADAAPVLRDSAVTGVPGFAAVSDTLPLAPTREFARPLLGTVGPVTAEIVKASGGVYGAGDDAGLSGLQARYDEQLRGTPGTTVRAVDGQGGARDLFSVDAVPGRPLRTTLDLGLQSAAERVLSTVRPASALVAIRPSTGDLLAVASGAGGGGLSTATVGRYAPGSTFKVVTSLALLRSDVRPTSMLSCPATTVVDGKRFKNYSDYPADGLGRISLATAVANSCNTAFIGERDTVSQARLADAAAALGLGVDQDLGFPAFLGSVPGTDAEAGSATGHAAAMIGQGRVLASPLAMATVAASVAEGGLVRPRLLPRQERTDPSAAAGPVTSREAAQLRGLMRGVVTRGSGAFLAGLPGAPVLAKTGTAEFGDKQPLQTHAWMIAVQGDLAVAVFVAVGESGSGTAGPLLEQFLRTAG